MRTEKNETIKRAESKMKIKKAQTFLVKNEHGSGSIRAQRLTESDWIEILKANQAVKQDIHPADNRVIP